MKFQLQAIVQKLKETRKITIDTTHTSYTIDTS